MLLAPYCKDAIMQKEAHLGAHRNIILIDCSIQAGVFFKRNILWPRRDAGFLCGSEQLSAKRIIQSKNYSSKRIEF